jgi:hypothetical protein
LSRRGRFGKYGDLKRKSRLRASRLAKRKRFGANAYLPPAGGGRQQAAGSGQPAKDGSEATELGGQNCRLRISDFGMLSILTI